MRLASILANALFLGVIVVGCGESATPTDAGVTPPVSDTAKTQPKATPFVNVGPYTGAWANGMNIKGGLLMNASGDSTVPFDDAYGVDAKYLENGSFKFTEIGINMSTSSMPSPFESTSIVGYVAFADSGVGLRRTDTTEKHLAWANVHIQTSPNRDFMTRDGWGEINVSEYGRVGGLVKGTYRMILKAQGAYPDIHINGRFQVKRSS